MATVTFAFGSNMEVAPMAQRCPGARLLGVASLPDRRFRINARGYPTVIPEPGAVVHGVLWELTPADEAELDRYEAVAEGLYERTILSVHMPDGTRADALVYRATDSTPGPPLPGFMERVVAAAREHRLPSEYLRELTRWLA